MEFCYRKANRVHCLRKQDCFLSFSFFFPLIFVFLFYLFSSFSFITFLFRSFRLLFCSFLFHLCLFLPKLFSSDLFLYFCSLLFSFSSLFVFFYFFVIFSITTEHIRRVFISSLNSQRSFLPTSMMCFFCRRSQALLAELSSHIFDILDRAEMPSIFFLSLQTIQFAPQWKNNSY